MQRIKGFVLAVDSSRRGNPVVKVRIDDANAGKLNGKKLIVASVHENIQLAQGLNVDFIVGTTTGSDGKHELRAVDVRLSEPLTGQ